MKYLVIVESPAKCKKIGSFLGPDYRVTASMGHFRDLPPKRMGINLDSMEAEYEIRKTDVANRLIAEVKRVDAVYLCTDPDREGEAIAWHISEILPKGTDLRRATFQEITSTAVKKAVKEYGEIDHKKVCAQQARRILDRLVGYRLSPLLWKAFPEKKGLSAGRVQSVAVRLVVDREAEIENFIAETFFRIHAHLIKDDLAFTAELIQKKGKKIKVEQAEEAEAIKKEIQGPFTLSSLKRQEQNRKPQPPFTTSNMQAKAAHVLKAPAAQSMSLAQKLYESGHITYHRTDSKNVSVEAIKSVRHYIERSYGKDYLPLKPQTYAKSKDAQEAHEAIRPTDVSRAEAGNNPKEKALYKLIRDQFISSQMKSGLDAITTARFVEGDYTFEARGREELFDGFRKINRHDFQEESRKMKEKMKDEKQKLPSMSKGDQVPLKKIEIKKIKTRPPPRYSEAGLIKKLEREGIGRPSTYASIVETILKRGYVKIVSRVYHAETLGIEVTNYLLGNFPKIMELGFTRRCESRMDAIASGETEMLDFLKKFWAYFYKQLTQRQYTRSVEVISPSKCPTCAKALTWEESSKFKNKFYFCCHDCRNYLETNSSKKPLNQAWLCSKKKS